MNITSTWAYTVSEMKHDKEAGTYDKTPVIQLLVREEGHGRWSRNIPNEGVQLLRLIVIGDDIGVNWGAESESETGSKLEKAKGLIPVCEMSA